MEKLYKRASNCYLVHRNFQTMPERLLHIYKSEKQGSYVLQKEIKHKRLRHTRMLECVFWSTRILECVYGSLDNFFYKKNIKILKIALESLLKQYY